MKRIIVTIAMLGIAIAIGSVLIGCSSSPAGKLYGEAKPSERRHRQNRRGAEANPH